MIELKKISTIEHREIKRWEIIKSRLRDYMISLRLIMINDISKKVKNRNIIIDNLQKNNKFGID